MSAADNARRWDGRTPGHYEVWYLSFNHAASGAGFWIRYTMEAPAAGKGAAYARLWFAYFCPNDPDRSLAINQIQPIDDTHCESDPFVVMIGDARLANDSAAGEMRGGGHRVKWDLTWKPAAETHRYAAGVWSVVGRVASTQLLSPNLDVPISGSIDVDGTRLSLSDEPGGQTHIWGSKHARDWAWGHCNNFVDYRGVALELVSARLERAGRLLPWVTSICLYLGEESYRFSGTSSRIDIGTGFYRFSASTANARIEGEFSCRPDDMIMARYTDPDGEAAYCNNTEIGDLRLTLFSRRSRLSRMRERVRLVARNTGHFEIGARKRDPAIGKDHITI